MQEEYKKRIAAAMERFGRAHKTESLRAAKQERQERGAGAQNEDSEFAIQIAVAKHLRMAEQVHGIRWMHCPNEGTRNKIAGARLKQAGMQRGFPDVVVFSKWLPGGMAAIELKTARGRPTPEQAAWIEFFVAQGCMAKVTRGLEETMAFVVDILGAIEQRSSAHAT